MKDMARKLCYELGSRPPYLRWDVRTAPSVHFSSACMSTKFDDCEVYGSIQVIDGQGNCLDLYNLDVTNSERVSKDGVLSLTGPEEHAILGFKDLTVNISLKDRIRDIELFNGCLYLDCVSRGSYDKLTKAVFQGDYGCVYLYYTAFEFATTAVLEFTIVNKGNDRRLVEDVYGSIAAYYGKNEDYCKSNDDAEHLKTSLFASPSHKRLRVMVGTPFKLLRNVMVVHAHSSLVIDGEMFCSQGKFVSGPIEFPAHDNADFVVSIPCENGSLELEVNVKWRNLYPLMYKKTIPRGSSALANDTKDWENKTMEPLKRARVFSDHRLHSSSTDPQTLPSTTAMSASKIRGGQGVEIFSVYVSGVNCGVSALEGTIEVHNWGAPTLIYDRKAGDHELLTDDKFVGIEMHSALTNPQLFVVVNLNDPLEHRVISDGRICWRGSKLNSGSLLWYNKRICSVVRGECGYAIVHYMIFTSAIKATIEVKFFCDDAADVKLYGVLFARYSGHEYSTNYERKYYQSRVFSKVFNHAVQLSTSSRVPLSKSVVVLPKTSHLIIEADLKTLCGGNSNEETIFDVEEFVVDLSSPACKEFRGKSCHIEVSVRYEDLYGVCF